MKRGERPTADAAQYTSVAFLERRATVLGLAKTWSISYLANLGGILFFLFINCIYAGVFASQTLQDHCVDYAVGKAQDPTWYNIFLSAIGGGFCLLPRSSIVAC